MDEEDEVELPSRRKEKGLLVVERLARTGFEVELRRREVALRALTVAAMRAAAEDEVKPTA